MRQILFMIPGLGLRVPSFGLMLMLACFFALGLTRRRARRGGLDPDIVTDLAFFVFAGGFLGARALFVAQNPGVFPHWTDALRVWQGGIVFYGCILGGLAGAVIYRALRPFPFLPMTDAVAPALALGIALGRIGCYLNGCCYGAISAQPWAVSFPAGTLPWARHVEAGLIPSWAARSLPVHPKQLYAAASGFLLLAILWAYHPRRRRDGQVMALLMVAYPISRFALEFTRGDAGGLHAGLTISQYISLGLLVGGLVAWRALSRRPPGLWADGPVGPSTSAEARGLLRAG